MSAPAVFCLMGATATGKTALALEIAARFAVEIVSVDSALIYRGMDIGSAKPSLAERAAVPHHLIDIAEPYETFSAGDFVARATRLAAEITARGRLPLLVGGTMLYYHAFENGLDRLPAADPAIRRRLAAEAREIGWAAMHARLAELDPASAARIRPSDPQRIQRALEVQRLTGRPLSRLQGAAGGYPGPVHKVVLGVDDRAALHRRIGARFERMLADGFIAEVEALRARGDLDASMPSMRCVGYRQAWRYLDGDYGREIMIERAQAATRQLAKRQLTWLRRQPAAASFDCLNYRKDAIFQRIEAVIRRP